jgi:hypothetical protein
MEVIRSESFGVTVWLSVLSTAHSVQDRHVEAQSWSQLHLGVTIFIEHTVLYWSPERASELRGLYPLSQLETASLESMDWRPLRCNAHQSLGSSLVFAFSWRYSSAQHNALF